VHDRIQKHREARKLGTVREDDPIPPVARSIAEEAQLLCFDEFTVTDIADAMVMSRLFTALFANGVVLVATSNVAPEKLYRDGLNRALFLPFIETLKQHTDIIGLDADTDYRMEKLARLPVYITPLGPDAEHLIGETWTAMTRGQRCAPAVIPLKGREISVPLACGDAARFGFADLCEKPLGARDFLAITDRYSTIFIENVPILADGRRNEAKRLILLVDTLYDRHVRLVMSAAAPPSELYAGRSGVEVFEFERTASRLTEMQSQDWLRDWAERHREVGVQAAAL
jgi:cell division protein ZapE